ncbi:hypothetical protein DPMN_012299 [Dreissena polymorpha]|uniref:Uncharacterized protein n=1 Tax=Dreissena polymorpha TaxID=45954 RepID=A0A9D4N7R3_DREPO|nr:hypothetical protein DPMN_012299 [Dreissena polymorpha]
MYSELPTRCTPKTSLFLYVSFLSSVTGLSRLSFSLFLKVTGHPEVNDVMTQYQLLNVDVVSQAPPVIKADDDAADDDNDDGGDDRLQDSTDRDGHMKNKQAASFRITL